MAMWHKELVVYSRFVHVFTHDNRWRCVRCFTKFQFIHNVIYTLDGQKLCFAVYRLSKILYGPHVATRCVCTCRYRGGVAMRIKQ